MYVGKNSAVFDSLFHSTHLYILAYERKRKEADDVYIHQLCCLSLLHDTLGIKTGKNNPQEPSKENGSARNLRKN